MRLHILTFATFLLVSISFAQETVIEDASLSGQFDKIYRTSTSYQKYKVIGKEKFLNLKQQVLDSLKTSKSLLTEKNNILKAERENIKKTEVILNKTKLDLEAAIQKEDSISLFGLQISKTIYNLILWTIVLFLLLALLYFIFKFSRNNILTKKAQNNLQDVEYEYEQHRKKTIEREQKLRRELQDEINKQRN
ncbi:hypothetical protein CW731_08155 [Polaribacter sp. ALD11]|uniref:hypothetical protein n=1 Tax=Polaribacter sp. ALD11 TaxID=2058137 RepID=UPI000C31398B|nr:hypothetical protein [Polaribacter sp. ALD11]AUC85262.1 hypothetical protein CW731_08155 [Polaribacter sp. ALD11]